MQSVKFSQEAVPFSSHLRGTSYSLKKPLLQYKTEIYELSAAIKWSSHSCFKVIHLPEKYSWVTAQRGKCVCFFVYVCLQVCLVTTHDSFHPSNDPVALSQSINKDQQSLFTLSFLNLSFLKSSFHLFSPDSLHLVTHSLSFSPSSSLPAPPQQLSHSPHTDSRVEEKYKIPPNLNKFTIIASPVVAQVWIHLCLTFHTSTWLDPRWKRGFGGLFNRDPNRVSFSFLYWHPG